MWDPTNPTNFKHFTPLDMLPFLEWWERQNTAGLQLHLADLFVEGAVDPYLELLAQGSPLPEWIKKLLAWRAAAAWTYEQGVDLSARLRSGIRGLVPESEVALYEKMFEFTPEDIAEIPPEIQRAFDRGSQFSMSWIKKLSNEARRDIGAILAANTLKNSNPQSAVPLLEQVLRRDSLAAKLGIPVEQVTPDMIQAWLDEATNAELLKLGRRAELIAVTEGARMQNLGILTAMTEQGEDYAYVRPHAGSCAECQRLLDGRVFPIQTLIENGYKNFGVKKAEWVGSMPLHPRCRHSPDRVPVKFRSAVRRVVVPDEGILLRWYGLSSEAAMLALGLESRADWLLPI
jgi:hypothetical protein